LVDVKASRVTDPCVVADLWRRGIDPKQPVEAVVAGARVAAAILAEREPLPLGHPAQMSKDELEPRIRNDPVVMRRLYDDLEREEGRLADKVIKATELAKLAQSLLDNGQLEAARKCLAEIVALTEEEDDRDDDDDWVGYAPIDT
jgi:hypothetical protein